MIKSTFLCSVAILVYICMVQGCYMRDYLTGGHICCHGYSKNIEGECVKQCKNCEHGICVGEDCICLHGRANDTCLSYCESRCKNGSCEEGFCQCNIGFKKTPRYPLRMSYDEYDYENDEDSECQPICEGCTNGQCVSPEKCECNEGYKEGRIGKKCEPICSNCGNGICVAPEKCNCIMGYKSSNNTCIPHCFGKCPDDKCIRPGTCDCGEGFQWSFLLEDCVPQCLFNRCDSIKEKCNVSNGKCDCKTGYERNSTTQKCDPICKEVCVNGYCSEPNTCSCNEKFTHRNETYCEPRCDPICPLNSECLTDGTCKCNVGYSNFSNICLKDCRCINGYCSDSQDNCICLGGYFPNPSNASECLTKCEIDGCENGYCSKSGHECTCHMHFHKDNSTGKCVKCEEGTYCNGVYMPFTCEPPCEHGTCIKKDLCVCHHGYDNIEGSRICEPICSGGCANGVCNSPHNCTCNKGYEKVSDKCQPICEHQCINGICSAPNVCNCTEGHEFEHNSKHKCEKIKCHHGEHHKGHKDCQSANITNTNSEAASLSSDSNGEIGVWAIVLSSIIALCVVSAAAFGVVWYSKSRRAAAIPLIENFVYNRMSE